jgi:hypothetical protein
MALLHKGWFWAKGLLLLTFSSLAAWVLTGASRWSALLVIVGGFAAVFAGFLAFADVQGAGSDWAKDQLRWQSRLPFYGRSAYWNDATRTYRMAGAISAMLGLTMIVIGFLRSVGSP